MLEMKKDRLQEKNEPIWKMDNKKIMKKKDNEKIKKDRH